MPRKELSDYYSLNQDGLPVDILDSMQKYLWTRNGEFLEKANGEPFRATLLNVTCQVEAYHPDNDRSLFIICAKPYDAPPAFGTCFPLMPGKEWLKDLPDQRKKGYDSNTFYLRDVSLTDPLWVYIYSSNGNNRDVNEHLKKMKLWEERFRNAAAPDLEAKSGLSMFGNLTGTSIIKDLANDLAGFAGIQWPDPLVTAAVYYPDAFPVLRIEMPLKDEVGISGSCKLKNVAVVMSSPLYFSPKCSQVGLIATLEFGANEKLEFEGDWPLDGDLIAARAKYQKGLPFIDAGSLPGSPALSPGTELDLEVQFSRSEKQLKKASFSTDLQEWEILPGILTLKEIKFAFSIFDPFGDKIVVASITARAAFGKEQKIELTCSGFYPGGQLSLRLVSKPSDLSIQQLIGDLSADVPSLPEKQQNLSVTDLGFEYYLHNNCFSALIDVSGDWEILKQFVLKDLCFRINKRDSYSFYVGAAAAIADVYVRLTADYDTGSWKFSGSTGPGQAIKIGKLIDSLKNAINNNSIDLPAPIKGLIIENLGISFDTGNKDFKFTCESKFPVCDTGLDIAVTIDLTHNGDSYQHEFGGMIAIGSAVFGLQFSKNPEETKFTAAWKETDGQTLGFNDLAKALGLASLDIPRELDLGLTAASFTYDTKDRTFVLTADSTSYGKAVLVALKPDTSWQFFFGLAVGKTINLSNLPVISRILDGRQTLAIEGIQVDIASAAINKQLAGKINEYITQTGYPKVPASGFESNVALSMSLNLGGQVVPLSIGTGRSSPGSGVKAGTPPLRADKSTMAITKVGIATGSNLGTVPVPQKAAADGTVWFNIQKSFGPVTFQKVGVKYKDNVLWFLMDSSISAAGLSVSVMGLAVGSPLKDFKPQFNIEGLGIDYSNSALKFDGSFLKMIPVPPVTLEFGGSVVVEAEAFGIEAVGAYVEISDQSSMFVFAMVEGSFGGPPAFFITGFAGGFGYNSQLRIPGQNEICGFPLIAGLANPDVIGGKKPTPLQALERLMGNAGTPGWITPKTGNIWLAAGIRFTTCELVRSSALLIAEFGRELQFALIGLSNARLPKEPDKKPYACLELQLKALFNPNEGVMSFSAVLSPNSFVFDPACKLTGGFAFAFWFGNNPRAGDFVLTLGGYSPYFSKPAWYPEEPRLGINWPIDSHVSITGEAYMALTPSALMAGGALAVQYKAGNLKAWFAAHADIIIWWNPLQFLADIGVSVGASYRVDVLGISKTFKAELGANLTLWGPPTGGTVTVHWWVIGFTVKFGADRGQLIERQTWEQFAAMLPEADASSKFTIQKGLAAAPPRSTQTAMLQAANEENDTAQVWLVRADDLLFSVDSTIPASELFIGENSSGAWKSGDKLNIKPMSVTGLTSWKRIYLKTEARTEIDLLDKEQPWTITARTSNVPAALWGAGDNTRLCEGEQLIKDQFTGFILEAPEPVLGEGPGAIDIAGSLGYDPLPSTGIVPLVSGSAASGPLAVISTDTVEDIERIMGDAASVRTQIHNALGALSLPRGKNKDLGKLAEDARDLFADQPLLAASNG